MNKVEQVAKAIYESRNGKGCTPWAKREMAHKAPYFSDARAAIEAMREPTEAMLDDGRDRANDYLDCGCYASLETARECWGAIIDAVLSEKDYGVREGG